MLIFWIAQAYTGWIEHNKDLSENGGHQISIGLYLRSGHFIQATFENWENEFLQMALYVMLTIGLIQVGSCESKPLEGKQEVDREPKPHKHGSLASKKRRPYLKAL